MKIALLPLDDRPCCFEQVLDLAKIGGLTLEAPPLSVLQSFTQIEQWLSDVLPGVDAAVLSSEMWFYGGLVASRKMEVSVSQAASRFEKLQALILKNPNVKFYISSVLLRLSITVDATQSEDAWRNIFNYSVQAETATELELEELRRQIPAHLLEEFLQARDRNHQVNLSLLKIAPKVSGVAFGQEDCAPQGLHRLEKARLAQAIQLIPKELQNRYTLMTGADELNSLLLMQAMMSLGGIEEQSIPLEVLPLDPKGLERISLYEDIAVIENLKLHLKSSPFLWQQDSTESQGQRLAICTFGKSGQGDLCFEPEAMSLDQAEPGLGEFIDALLPGDALLDLSHANGASRVMTERLLRNQKWQDLGAFSAWNTTGNRLGTLIAHLGIRAVAQALGKWDSHADQNYLACRILDDFIYQSCVRPELQVLCKSRGLNPWALGSSWSEFSELADQRIKFYAKHFGFDLNLSAKLPWPRLFEASIVIHNPQKSK